MRFARARVCEQITHAIVAPAAALVGCWGRVVLVAGLLETEDEEKCCMNDGPVPGLNLEVTIKYRQQGNCLMQFPGQAAGTSRLVAHPVSLKRRWMLWRLQSET